jgi:hypothetical protein
MLVAIACTALVLQALAMFKKDEDNSPASWEIDDAEFVTPIEIFQIISRLSEEDMMEWANPADVIEIIELSDFVSELEHECLCDALDNVHVQSTLWLVRMGHYKNVSVNLAA